MPNLRIALSLLALLTSLTVTAADMPLSIDDTLALKRVAAAHLSPGGEQIAYVLAVPRQLYKEDDGPAWRELHVVDLAGNSRAYVSGKVLVEQVAWAADGKSLYFVAKRDAEAEFSSIHSIALDGGEAKTVFTHSNAIGTIHPSPDGQQIAFLATDAPPARRTDLDTKGFRALVYEESIPSVKVWMLDLESGEATAEELSGSASVLQWAPDSSRYAVALAPTPLVDDIYTARDIAIVAAGNGKIERRFNHTGKLGAFRWSPDARQIAYIGGADINDPSEGRLYVSRVDAVERRELLPSYPGHVHDLEWRDAATVRYLGSRNLWTEVREVAADTPRAADPAPASGPIIRTIDSHSNTAVIAAVADTPSHPSEVYVSTDGADWRRLTDSNPILAERQLAKQETLQYAARDGLKLDAVVLRPIAGARKAGNPLILFIHGGPEAHYSNGWMSNYSQPAHALAAEGYTVAYPNYRGSTGRGVKFSKLGQNDYAEEEFNDIVDLKRHLVKELKVNPAKVGISGGSYGGYASMWAASALSEEFAAAVAFVGISNQISKFGTGDIPREMYNVHSRTWPWDDWMWMLKRSPIYHADKTRTPLLIMAGDKDPRVHPSQSLEMYRNVKLRTDTPVRLVFYPGEVHGNRNTAARYDYALRLQRWMDFYLKGAAKGLPAYEIDHAAALEAAEQ